MLDTGATGSSWSGSKVPFGQWGSSIGATCLSRPAVSVGRFSLPTGFGLSVVDIVANGHLPLTCRGMVLASFARAARASQSEKRR